MGIDLSILGIVLKIVDSTLAHVTAHTNQRCMQKSLCALCATSTTLCARQGEQMISCKQMGPRHVAKTHQEHSSWQQVHLKERWGTDRYLGLGQPVDFPDFSPCGNVQAMENVYHTTTFKHCHCCLFREQPQLLKQSSSMVWPTWPRSLHDTNTSWNV